MMTVKDILYACDSSVKAMVLNGSTNSVILKGNSVGYLLGTEHWCLDEEVKEIGIVHDVLVIVAEDE